MAASDSFGSFWGCFDAGDDCTSSSINSVSNTPWEGLDMVVPNMSNAIREGLEMVVPNMSDANREGLEMDDDLIEACRQ